MRAVAIWTLMTVAMTVLPTWSSANEGVVGTAETASVRSLLRTATVAENAKDWPAAYASISAALDDPTFSKLDADTQHFALALGTHASLQIGKPSDAHRFAVRATEMPERDIDDWRGRLTSAMKIGEVADEALCVAEFARTQGVGAEFLSDSTIFQVFRDSQVAQAAEVRADMLLALYQRRWRPADGGTASRFWLELVRLQLLQNEPEPAARTANLIDDPDDIIIMRSDFRFRPVLKSPHVESNAHRAALKRLKQFKEEVESNPRSLAALVRLMYAMSALRMDAEVLTLAESVDRRMSTENGGVHAYDDSVTEIPWIFHGRATALRHLGRYDEALEQLRRAARWQGTTDKVSHAINLASLLCEMGMPEEAMTVLPADEKASAYGKMQIEAVRLAAAVQLDRGSEVEAALGYLREHGRDAPGTLQHALVKAGQYDEAERWLLARLDDSFMRSQALLELQQFSEPPYPASAPWHIRSAELKSRLSVRAAVRKIGDIDRYSWRCDTFE
jgi:tetratricopeptide (TPR) repeat protein